MTLYDIIFIHYIYTHVIYKLPLKALPLAQDCPSWGAPFLHQSFMDGSTRQRNGQAQGTNFAHEVREDSELFQTLQRFQQLENVG